MMSIQYRTLSGYKNELPQFIFLCNLNPVTLPFDP